VTPTGTHECLRHPPCSLEVLAEHMYASAFVEEELLSQGSQNTKVVDITSE
jgi:hypothetical protein